MEIGDSDGGDPDETPTFAGRRPSQKLENGEHQREEKVPETSKIGALRDSRRHSKLSAKWSEMRGYEEEKVLLSAW